MFRLFNYLGRYRKFLPVLIISSILSVLSLLLAPLIIGDTIDEMIMENNFSIIIKSLLVLLVLYLVSNFFLWLFTYLTNKATYYTINNLRYSLFLKLEKLPIKFYDKNVHGDTASRFTNDINNITDGLLQGVIALLQGIFTIIGAAIIMFFIDPIMTLIVLISAPLSYIAGYIITSKSQNLFKKQTNYLGNLNGYAEEMIGGYRELKAFNREDKSIEEFNKINDDLYTTGVKAQFISALVNPSTRLISNLIYSLIGIYGSINLIIGNITPGVISSFLIFTLIFSKPFNDITNVWSQLQIASASAKRVFNILDEGELEEEGNKKIVLKTTNGNLEFKDVYLSYNKDKPLIKGFNLNISSGDKIAVVGKTGAGKTTLVNLLLRFYDVNSGGIFIDGINIREVKRNSLRKQFGLVLQDSWFFKGTIRDNIAYAKNKATMEEVVAAAKEAGADSFIRRLSNGYDTVINSSGSNISEGEKQLLAIARVFLANPSILILDEATSSIDTYTEIKLQKAFDKITKDRTSFIIAHRLSTIRNADLILVMKKGSIVEKGSHEELLEKGGYYKSLYRSQFFNVEE